MKPDKKISQHHLSQVLNHIEKYISYIFIYYNKSNGEILSILPTVSIIYNLISKFVYNKHFKMFNETQSNVFFIDDEKENSKYLLNNQIEDIKFDSSHNTTKESLIPNIQDLKQFFDINNKSFKETCNNLKKIIHNLRQNYRNNASEYSDFSETTNSKRRSQREYTGECDDYRIVNEKILNLKKF